MAIASILKENGGGGGRWDRNDEVCGDHFHGRRVRFELTPEQEIKADKPYRPYGMRKEKKVRKGKRKISVETWSEIHRFLQEEDGATEGKLVKSLSVKNEKAVEESNTGGTNEPEPESERFSIPAIFSLDSGRATVINKFKKRWEKIIKMRIKREGSKDRSNLNHQKLENTEK